MMWGRRRDLMRMRYHFVCEKLLEGRVVMMSVIMRMMINRIRYQVVMMMIVVASPRLVLLVEEF